jgi:predicted ATPase
MVVYTAFNTTPTWARGLIELDANPRTPVYAQPVPRLDSRGIQLINALKTLHDADNDAAWRELERDFRAEFPFCSSIKFPTAESGGRIGLKWTDARSGRALTADHLSDGMLAYLQLLAALHAPDLPAALGFDEPESHLHPGLLRRVIARMEARSTVTPLFIATHSDAMLDFLEDPASAVHILEFKDKEGTRIQRLEREALEQWRAEYKLSELRAQGQLDRGSRQWGENA